MEILLLTFGALLILAGLIGAFLPVIPGLPFSYAGLLVLQFTQSPFSITFMVVWALIVAFIMFMDGVIPAWGTRKFGGTAYGVTGSVIGMIAGIFIFPPFGIIIGPIAGAFIGELLAGSKSDTALKSALGSFAGFMAATGLKVLTAGIIGWYYFSSFTLN